MGTGGKLANGSRQPVQAREFGTTETLKGYQAQPAQSCSVLWIVAAGLADAVAVKATPGQ